MQYQQVFLVFVVICGALTLAGPVIEPVKKFNLRRMLVHCLDSQAEEGSSDDIHFTSCLADQLSASGEVKLLPGVVLSSEDAPSGGRAMGETGSTRAIHLSLPWSNATARWLGGWGSPSLVLTGDPSALDVAVELKKEDPEGESRGKKLKKLLLPLLIGLKLKSALFGMLSYGAVAALAGKALFVSVASLIVSAVLGMRRMYQHWDSNHGHAYGSSAQYSSYEPSYYHHHRSYETAAAASLGTDSTMQHAHITSYAPAATADHLAYKGYSTAA